MNILCNKYNFAVKIPKTMKNLLLILLSLTILSGCKKYEEGPALTLRTPERRLEGKWSAYRAQKNGVDLIGFAGYKFEFKKNGDYIPAGLSAVINKPKWEFIEDKNTLLINWGAAGGFTGQQFQAFKVIELTKKSLRYSFPSGNATIEYFCERD